MRSESKIADCERVTSCIFHQGTELSIREDNPRQIPSVSSESTRLIL